MIKIKAIVFDWGGVLIDNPADGFMEHCSAALGVSVDLLTKEFSDYEDRFQKGLISESDFWKSVCKKHNLEEPITSLWRDAVNDIFNDRKEVYQLVDKLRESGYVVGILSNTEMPVVDYFYDEGYDKYFDVKVFSCTEKTRKPGEKIYEILLERLGTKPEEVIYIDDKIKYVDGAKGVGIEGILFEDYEGLVKELALRGVKI